MTAIRQAFATARFSNPTPLAEQVLQSLARTKPKLSRDAQRGWSTQLSFRTYNALKNQGVLE
jgi:hypothetical protein